MLKALPNLISLPNDDIDHKALAKTLKNVIIDNSNKNELIIIRDRDIAVIQYDSYQMKDALGSIADLYEASEENGFYGFDELEDYDYRFYQIQLRQMFTQEEINNFPLSG